MVGVAVPGRGVEVLRRWGFSLGPLKDLDVFFATSAAPDLNMFRRLDGLE